MVSPLQHIFEPVRMGIKRVCVLKSGGEFTPKHVKWLARQVPGLICLSDVPVDGVETIPLIHNWPKWFSKFELFRPDIDGDLLYFDLDTVIVGDLESLDVGKTTMLSDFYRPHLPASGLMYIKQEDKQRVWDYWIKNPVGHMQRARTTQCWGDQGILRGVLGRGVNRWDEGLAVSYKVHCKRGVPKGASVVCFHGNPRPWNARQNWIPAL